MGSKRDKIDEKLEEVWRKHEDPDYYREQRVVGVRSSLGGEEARLASPPPGRRRDMDSQTGVRRVRESLTFWRGVRGPGLHLKKKSDRKEKE